LAGHRSTLVRAQSRGGLIHYSARGGRNDAEAVKWSRLAAAPGDAAAQFRLGLTYSEGQGVVHFPASESSNRNLAIKNRDVVAGKLSREEIAESQKLAREWRPIDCDRQDEDTS
jgi:TPR repeat protein